MCDYMLDWWWCVLCVTTCWTGGGVCCVPCIILTALLLRCNMSSGSPPWRQSMIDSNESNTNRHTQCIKALSHSQGMGDTEVKMAV